MRNGFLESDAPGRLGGSAILPVAEALPGFVGTDAARALFARAGLAELALRPAPRRFDEAEVTRLHAELRHALGGKLASQVARGAGRRTADDLLTQRIPKSVQWLLKALPAPLAARALLGVLRRQAPAIVGSGRFEATAGYTLVLSIQDNPLCRGLDSEVPACDYFAAVFECLFRALVHPDARVAETACEACGDDSCRFEVRWQN
jgi:divinyl protochlorophyllide a 8-vinyl-reductase